MSHFPPRQGLYHPEFEKDSCGVGFVAHILGRADHQMVLDAGQMLANMDHRGAYGCESNTGDGAGMMTGLPIDFLRKVAQDQFGVDLPTVGQFAAGNVFLPKDPQQRATCKRVLESLLVEHGQQIVGWRPLPVDFSGADIGPLARKSAPHFEQLFVVAAPGIDEKEFERRLYIARKQASHRLRTDPHLSQRLSFYVCSLSTRLMIYKGMLTSGQVLDFFDDLRDPDYKTHLAMVHSRFSTNTFPSWDRAQPNRLMSHNGEINTLRGNVNWMRAREGLIESPLYGDDIRKLSPVVEPLCSDSGSFDNVLEFLVLGGRSLPSAIMMMIPEAWQSDHTMPSEKRSYYEYHSCLMEPWDGPASITFTNGRCIGAILDRNGLRPSRYYITHDQRVIMASEVGALPVPPEQIKEKGRLRPGRMFLIDFDEQRLIPDRDIKHTTATRRPYGRWIEQHCIELADLKPQNAPHGFYPDTLLQRMQAFGYTMETGQFMLLPLVNQGRDPIGSMGNDSALACLSDKPRVIYDYFKQLFAQVTNPAIDSIREEVVMSLSCFIGPEGNVLDAAPNNCARLRLPHPILTNEELSTLADVDYRGWRSKRIDVTFPRNTAEQGLISAIDRICEQSESAIDDGYKIVILTDRELSQDRVPVSMLMACGAVHHHLVERMKRTQIGIVVETGEAREVHHHCLLLGYGVDAINPYLAFESLWQARRQKLVEVADFVDDDAIVAAYRKGVAKGILKIMAKMGISTLQSYKGAQIFEAVGLHQSVIDRCFVGTASRIQGVDFAVLAEETVRRHNMGYPVETEDRLPVLSNLGEYHWRSGGEKHAWDPPSIANVQLAARTNDAQAYEQFAKHVNEDEQTRCSLRGLLTFRSPNNQPIPIEEVEPASHIVKRFCTGAMSFGSISAEAHETLAIAMNRLGGKSNTGEGGEDPARWQPLPNGDSRRSAIKQVASGRFGVTISYLTNADELQIKISQGAKPGEGGELPGKKVDEAIAAIRYSTPGVGLISPPPHHDIYSIEDLKQLIHDLKNANPQARISVKLVSEVGVGTIATGVAKAYADHILISGDNGGTGASPLTSIKHAGLPWELGIAETHQTLMLNGLRNRVVLQTDGGLKTGRDVVIAAMLGAEEMGFSTAPLITLGCIMMRKCHLNTCPVGIATQDPQLRARFQGQPDHVVNYLIMVAEEARRILADLGFRRLIDVVGRTDCLETNAAIDHWKARGIDLRCLLAPASNPFPADHPFGASHCTRTQNHQLELALDNQLIEQAQPAIDHQQPVQLELSVVNTNRAVGTMLSHQVAKKHGEAGLPDDTIRIRLSGAAGQSFGAFLAHGITLELEGDANDYVGKGLSGGRIVIYPPKNSTFMPEHHIIAGNVLLYGATRGQAFIRGQVAERFAVRNSGADAVVEGVGDHGCEYMTGGRVVVLGPTGRNFAAGMSGGVAYVWDPHGEFAPRCNLRMVELEPLTDATENDALRELIRLHQQYTQSGVAQSILDQWPDVLRNFVKVMPTDYRRVLQAQAVASTHTTSQS